ncbi:NAD(+) diphosphatase [Nocardioides sp. Leaf285]|uniref:NAD(+) diphosphatase n=1 Tax=Nocardioides sp. Leaf285 TaxID=1736322 RepID=UPI000703737E|nr:NAD(+) diphosphatase [Nocardioides sp. Leaf285]KQP64467.1 NADH pyrophosphatase [Nocardioides sp. Leaf285]
MTAPHTLLTVDAHDRASVRRRDEAWLERQWADPATRVLVVAGAQVRPRGGRIDWVRPDETPDGLRVLLGERDDRAWFALVTDRPDPDEPGWAGLRDLLPLLAGDAPESRADAPLLFHALGIAEWLAVTRFCPRDGTPLEPRAAGHELTCPRCGRTQFPRTDAAVIMLVTHGEPGADDELCLLGRQRVWPRGRFSTLAGFYEPGESLEDAVRREVAEETGVEVGEVSYFGNQPWPMPASLMVGFVGRATSTRIEVDEVEIEEARWFTRAQMIEETRAGTLVLPGGVSISRSLVEHWYGGPLPGQW